MLRFLILCSIFAGGFAEMKNGKCPSIQVDQFYLQNLAGKWYEYQFSTNLLNRDLHCVQVELALGKNGRYGLQTNYNIKSLNKDSVIVADVKVVGRSFEFAVDVPIIGPIPTSVVILEATSDFAVVYSCLNERSQYAEKAWVVTTSPETPPADMEDRVRAVFKKHKLQMPEMFTANFDHCREYFASYNFQPTATPAELSFSCFFTPSCFAPKFHEFISSISSFVPLSF